MCFKLLTSLCLITAIEKVCSILMACQFIKDHVKSCKQTDTISSTLY